MLSGLSTFPAPTLFPQPSRPFAGTPETGAAGAASPPPRSSSPAQSGTGNAQNTQESTRSGQDEERRKPGQTVADPRKQLSEAELDQLRELQKRDREVRAHELAHVAVGGSLVTQGASFSYETGPDGKRYAVGGEVRIDTSPGKTPEETLDKAQQIKAAALAPANPSPQDRQVAAMANQMAMQAQIELAMQRREEARQATQDTPGEGEGRTVNATAGSSRADEASNTTPQDEGRSRINEQRIQGSYIAAASAPGQPMRGGQLSAYA
ncbi:MAG: putative metalloprotease CJM1_0395 family protein [Rhodocyclaceae bacterium]|jgi:hypothetical protein|nr:putative metalloprotease CJM1_0395 family protein [Rhodocyclaceae bacterium]